MPNENADAPITLNQWLTHFAKFDLGHNNGMSSALGDQARGEWLAIFEAGAAALAARDFPETLRSRISPTL